jgi:hypothetical protein
MERGKKRNAVRETVPLQRPLAAVRSAKNSAKYGNKRLRKNRKYHENLGKAQGEIPAVEFKSWCPCQESVIFEKRSPIFVFLDREDGRPA